MKRFPGVETAPRVLLALTVLLAGLALVPAPARVSAGTDQKLAGADQFSTRGCTHCHGVTGEGTDRGPSLRDVRRKMSAAQIKQQIVVGGQGMPAFGSVLDSAQVDDLVVYLRSRPWKKLPAAPAAPATPPAATEPPSAN